MADQNIMRSASGFLATALTTADANPWRVDTTYDSTWATKLIGPDRQELYLDFGWSENNDRIEISGFFPRDHDGSAMSHKNPKISVGRTRDPLAIAKDIVRRLLPDYRAELADVQARVERNAQTDADRVSLAAVLADLSGGQLTGSGRGERPKVSLRFAEGKGWADFDVDSGTSATLKVSYGSEEIMRALAETLRRFN